ncbi:hypothetical protein RND81_05G193700 [Saponaria officinalis]|uniref:Prolamin-like domain-containing protein n=1 Tax=Saponaria officinalis TaxID=3572 RepID=A0AAW1L2I2_SAPOF
MDFKVTSIKNFLVTILLLLGISFVMARPNTITVSALARGASPIPSEDSRVQKCAIKIGEICGDSIFHYVFGAGKHVSKECCARLSSAGKKCHDLLTNVTIRLEHFPKQQAKETRRKNDKAWELCNKDGQISN